MNALKSNLHIIMKENKVLHKNLEKLFRKAGVLALVNGLFDYMAKEKKFSLNFEEIGVVVDSLLDDINKEKKV